MEEKGRILIVDDELNMRKGLSDVLEQEGYKVTLAENGQEAMGLIRTAPFDLAIVDVKMAWMNGMELIKKIEQNGSKTPVIVITAYPSLETAIEAVGNGVSDYIVKPFNMERMNKAVEKCIKRKHSSQEIEKLSDELREANKRLEETREALVQSGKLVTMGQLGAGVFHEVKNLLGVMSVSAYYLKKSAEIKDPKAREHIEIIEQEIAHSNDLVMSLLKLSRQVEHEVSSAEINKVVEEVMSLVEHELSLHNIMAIRRYGAGLPEVQVDIDQIKQVFLNIILNAKDAMSSGGGGELRITTSYDPAQYDWSSYVEIKISNTGPAIERDDIEKIFNPFFTTKKQDKSIGLGLAVSREIVKKHKGTIGVESEPGRETTFSIRLPIKKAEGTEVAVEQKERFTNNA